MTNSLICKLILGNIPNPGDVIRGSGSIRKLCWQTQGRGNRGWVRIIYYLKLARGQIWLLTLYAKNVQQNILVQVLQRIKESIDNE
ncbi:MAG: type II toxin-antitoxin system RelE/ParE family toxin [Deinococcota bacterium]